MKIKNVFLASLLTKLGHEVKAELVVDDANGTSLTFPDISDIGEIAEGVAVDAADGTYVIANGDDAITCVVMGGVVTSVTVETPTAATEPVDAGEINAEMAEVLETLVTEIQALKGENAALATSITALKASLKHPVEPTTAPKAENKNQFKILD